MSLPSDNAQTREVSDEYRAAFRKVLAESVEIVEGEDIPYLLGGSLASRCWGRPAPEGDVDMVVGPTDAQRLLKALERAGFDTAKPEPEWLYKAKKSGITVDVIFEMEGDLYMDDDMVARGSVEDVDGTRARVMGPEDFIVSQAMSTKEDTSDYWYNALGVLAKTDVDWDYLVDRASSGPRRVLSILLYAQSNDLPVPDSAIQRLIQLLYPAA
jgi:hypothetical protein